MENVIKRDGRLEKFDSNKIKRAIMASMQFTPANIFADIIDTKVNDVTRDNANMNADTPAGMMMKFAAESTKPYVDAYLLTDEARTAVEGNYLYIHK